MKSHSKVVIIKHDNKKFVGRTGSVFFQDLKHGECYINLDTPVWLVGEDGNLEFVDFCSVDAKNVRPSKQWREYTPGFMEGFI